MDKNELINKDSMIEYFKNIKELEERKFTYDRAISDVQKKIEDSKVYSYYYLPKEPEKPEKVKSLKAFFSFIQCGFEYLICWSILAGVLLLIAKMIGNDKLEFILSIICLVCLFLTPVISLYVVYIFPKKAYKNALKEYNESCESVNAYNRQQKEEAEQRTELIITERTPDLDEWQYLNKKVEERLEYLYYLQGIPEKYQNAVAMSFFVSYLESGRCDTLKECMNKYDDDVMYYQLKGKLEEIYQRISEMEGRLSREIRYLQKSFEADLEDIQILVDNNSSQIDRISYNQKTNELLSTTLLIGNL